MLFEVFVMTMILFPLESEQNAGSLRHYSLYQAHFELAFSISPKSLVSPKLYDSKSFLNSIFIEWAPGSSSVSYNYCALSMCWVSSDLLVIRKTESYYLNWATTDFASSTYCLVGLTCPSLNRSISHSDFGSTVLIFFSSPVMKTFMIVTISFFRYQTLSQRSLTF